MTLRDQLRALLTSAPAELKQKYQNREAELRDLENGTAEPDEGDTTDPEEKIATLEAAQRALVGQISRSENAPDLDHSSLYCVPCWLFGGEIVPIKGAGRGEDDFDLFCCERRKHGFKVSVTR